MRNNRKKNILPQNWDGIISVNTEGGNFCVNNENSKLEQL